MSTYENDLFSLVMAIQKWHPYLLGQSFVVWTDQHNLKFLLEQKVGTPFQQKWITKLLGYELMTSLWNTRRGWTIGLLMPPLKEKLRTKV